MASPGAFLSSPAHARRNAAQAMVPSSPELPSVQEILLQKPTHPQLKSGSRAAPIPENATATFTSAGSVWRSLQAEDSEKSTTNSRAATQTVVEDIDTSVSVIEIETRDAPQRRKPRRQKRAAVRRVEAPIETSTGPQTPADTQPWKKYKSPTKSTTGASESKPCVQNDSTSVSGHEDDAEQVRSCFFKSPEPHKSKRMRVVKEVESGPLNLAAAMARRTNWTPPAQNPKIIFDSGPTPRLEIVSNIQEDDETSEPFENLLASFKCSKPLQSETYSNSASEDSSFLKKRKLLEFVPTGVHDGAEPSRPDQPPTKRKAPKKKTRTITGIATAAYRPQTQPDQMTASVSEHQGSKATKPTATGNEKSKPRKRQAKTSTKKQPPLKPVLLSPGAALNQVARQDFVFGTSSQLAREQSPTLLRDLQIVMRASNQLDSIDLTTPLNSDALEPPENRPSLWDAGARDADGDLFDVEVLNFAERSGLPEPAKQADPFGYVRCDKDDFDSLPTLPAVVEHEDDDSLVNLSDILPPPGRSEPPGMIGVSSPRPESELPARVTSPGQTSSLVKNQDERTHAREDANGGQHQEFSERRPSSETPRQKSSFELYSDAQLARQVAQYGFKPIKKRTAMIALLSRCEQESARPGRGVAGPASTTAAVAFRSVSTSTVATIPEKRPRGRPRKASVDEATLPKQPPPSAQPPESPRRQRGRPRKDGGSPSLRISVTTSAKDSTKGGSPAPATPKRKAKAARTVIEIPDSQSDAANESSASPCSSPDPTFSPAEPVDLSLTVDEDTELSLSTPPTTDQETSLFTYITKAVTTAPRTKDPAQPSWHEKMLMYDAIVLEDLTTWLNCGQLTRVGCDWEASVGEVKKWCESKSVLCLWEKNLRGKERKRY